MHPLESRTNKRTTVEANGTPVPVSPCPRVPVWPALESESTRHGTSTRYEDNEHVGCTASWPTACIIRGHELEAPIRHRPRRPPPARGLDCCLSRAPRRGRRRSTRRRTAADCCRWPAASGVGEAEGRPKGRPKLTRKSTRDSARGPAGVTCPRSPTGSIVNLGDGRPCSRFPNLAAAGIPPHVWQRRTNLVYQRSFQGHPRARLDTPWTRSSALRREFSAMGSGTWRQSGGENEAGSSGQKRSNRRALPGLAAGETHTSSSVKGGRLQDGTDQEQGRNMPPSSGRILRQQGAAILLPSAFRGDEDKRNECLSRGDGGSSAWPRGCELSEVSQPSAHAP
ncbi:unnamed protein product [Diplocarpon coronariae]